MWADWATSERRAIESAGRWRTRPDPGDNGLVSFASNDYLGLSAHPSVIAAAHAALDRWGAGSGSARLVDGSLPPHAELEAALAEWKGTEGALLFPTGYAANLGALATLGAAGSRIVSDERNHASIIDACRLARAPIDVYRHGDVAHAESLLAGAGEERRLLVTETVFSMDGDLAPVDELAGLCRRHRALLVLDEAHAVLGPHPDLVGVEHLRVGTLSKFLGSLGGFVAGSRALVELLVNRARPFVFTTAPTPADAAAALAALGVLRAPEGTTLAERLAANVARVSPGHGSPIVPVIVGDEGAAIAASSRLRAMGLLVPAIRPPSVPPGTSRLRISVSATHTDADLDLLLDALAGLAA
ncbi:MAG: aminotransferase class I/II-fold pyridoxal phosphate-dependent enzyme [Acidimicrobiales bacterium]